MAPRPPGAAGPGDAPPVARPAIRSATSVAAELLAIEDRTGSIREGLEADLIVVDQNPLDDILSLQDVLMVMNDGEVVLDRLSFALE